jgi:hypothetical protein
MTRHVRHAFTKNSTEMLEEYCTKALTSSDGMLRNHIMGGSIHPSMRMVITPGWPSAVNCMVVPRVVANDMAVPYKSSGTMHYGLLRSGTWAPVVRHPCFTQHNVQPMVVDVQDVDSVQFPVWYCSQYNETLMVMRCTCIH